MTLGATLRGTGFLFFIGLVFFYLAIFLGSSAVAASDVGGKGDVDLFGTKVSRDAIVHLDLNTFWFEHQEHLVQQFVDGVHSYMHQNFKSANEYDAATDEAEFTSIYHPDLAKRCRFLLHYYPLPGSNRSNLPIGIKTDLCGTAYTAINTLPQPDVLVIACDWSELYDTEPISDLVTELKSRHIKLIVLVGRSAPYPGLSEYARESGGSYSQLVFHDDDDIVGTVKVNPDPHLVPTVVHEWHPPGIVQN